LTRVFCDVWPDTEEKSNTFGRFRLDGTGRASRGDVTSTRLVGSAEVWEL
jgi:hypothetical protein